MFKNLILIFLGTIFYLLSCNVLAGGAELIDRVESATKFETRINRIIAEYAAPSNARRLSKVRFVALGKHVHFEELRYMNLTSLGHSEIGDKMQQLINASMKSSLTIKENDINKTFEIEPIIVPAGYCYVFVYVINGSNYQSATVKINNFYNSDGEEIFIGVDYNSDGSIKFVDVTPPSVDTLFREASTPVHAATYRPKHGGYPEEHAAVDFYNPSVKMEVSCSFQKYLATRQSDPKMFVWPAGTKVRAGDERGIQQEHRGWYTISNDPKVEPHVVGDIYDPAVWAQIPDGSLDVIHVEKPGGLLFYRGGGCGSVSGKVSDERDEFLLNQMNKKLKKGGSLFVSLRSSRFMAPNVAKLSLSQVKEILQSDPYATMRDISDYDFDSSVDCYSKFFDKRPEYIREALQNSKDKERLVQEYKKLFAERRASLGDEATYQAFVRPYIFVADKQTRQAIYRKYDDLFGRLRFVRKGDILEFSPKDLVLPAAAGLDSSGAAAAAAKDPRVTEGIIDGMCFIESRAEYVKECDLENIPLLGVAAVGEAARVSAAAFG